MKFDFFSSIVAGSIFLIFMVLFLVFRRSRQATAALRYSNIGQIQATGTSWKVNFRWLLPLLRISAIIFLLIAFARPQQGLEIIRTAKEGIAVQMVIDRSSSMKEPLKYQGEELDRLEVVKRVFKEFVLGNKQELKGRNSDMIGLTSFAGFVEENAPLTLDHNTIVNFARTITPAVRIEDGTMIGDAIYFATLRLISVDELLKKAGEKNNDYKVNSKIIILLTDGQQTRGGMNPVEAAKFAKENGIKVYTIAITNDSSYTRKDSLFGQFFSLGNRQLDTTLLEQVAETTGAIFAKASSGEALVEIYKQIDQLEKSKFEENFTTYKEQFSFFVLIGLGLLFLEIILAQTVFRKIP